MVAIIAVYVNPYTIILVATDTCCWSKVRINRGGSLRRYLTHSLVVGPIFKIISTKYPVLHDGPLTVPDTS